LLVGAAHFDTLLMTLTLGAASAAFIRLSAECN